MISYEIMPHDDWPVFHDLARRTYGLLEAWPVEVAGHHLRWLAGQRILGRLTDKNFPTAATLGNEWNWPKWRAAEFLADLDGWMDPYRPVTMAFLRGDRFVGANRKRKQEEAPTVDRRQADGGPTVDTEQRHESQDNPDGGPTVDRREADAARGNLRARSPSTYHLEPEPLSLSRGDDPAEAPIEREFPSCSSVHDAETPAPEPEPPIAVLVADRELGRQLAAALRRVGVVTIDQLTARTFEQVRFARGVGEPSAVALRDALEARGLGFAASAATGPPARAAPSSADAFAWDDVETWPETFDPATPATWPAQARSTPPPKRIRERFPDLFATS